MSDIMEAKRKAVIINFEIIKANISYRLAA